MPSDLTRVVDIAKSDAEIDAITMREWITSADREIKGVAFILLMEHPARCALISNPDRCSFILEILKQALFETGGEFEFKYWFGQFDALLYVNMLFQQWHAGTLEQSSLIDELVTLLGDLCLIDDGKHQQRVIDVTLEHMLGDPKYRRMFDKWRGDARLNRVFEQACQAGDEWDRQGRSC